MRNGKNVINVTPQTRVRRKKSRERHVIQAIPKIALGVAAGKSNVQIGKECGVGAATVRRLLRDPEFGDRLQEISQQMIDGLDGREYSKEAVRDVAVALGILVDKMRLSRGEPTEIHAGGDVAIIVERLQAITLGGPGLAQIAATGQASLPPGPVESGGTGGDPGGGE